MAKHRQHGTPRWPGDPTSMMASKIEKLLKRLRLQYPFPHDQMEVLKSLYPEDLLDVPDYRGQNFRSCWTWGHRVQVALDAHDERVFWMKFDHRVPAPDKDLCLSMPDENPYYVDTLKWLVEASLLQERVTNYGLLVQRYLEWAESAKVVELDWAEMSEFVAYPVNKAHATDKRIRRTGNRPEITMQQREDIIEMLATATLLEDATCGAWVGWSES